MERELKLYRSSPLILLIAFLLIGFNGMTNQWSGTPDGPEFLSEVVVYGSVVLIAVATLSILLTHSRQKSVVTKTIAVINLVSLGYMLFTNFMWEVYPDLDFRGGVYDWPAADVMIAFLISIVSSIITVITVLKTLYLKRVVNFTKYVFSYRTQGGH